MCNPIACFDCHPTADASAVKRMSLEENIACLRALMLSSGPLPDHVGDDAKRQDFDSLALVHTLTKFTADGCVVLCA